VSDDYLSTARRVLGDTGIKFTVINLSKHRGLVIEGRTGIVVFPSTPGDRRGVKAFRADLRRVVRRGAVGST
jgi:hypothetical protein